MCSKCGTSNNIPCGCQDQGLTTVPTFTCPPGVDCPNPEPCSEIMSADCIIYTGPAILDLGINTGDRFSTIIQKLILLATNPGCITPTSTCKSITSLSIPALSNTSIQVGWGLSPTATGYQVEFKLSTAVTWTLMPLQGPTATANVISGLVPNTLYDIRVNALCVSGNCYSVTLQIKTLV